MKKGGLGKGLEALFADNDSYENVVTMLNISDIEPNRDQPRHTFEEAPLAELADSIREHGILQPLLVRPMEQGGYQIVAGERRWRASRMAGLTQVPAIIREMSDSTTMLLALIENLQRENLNSIEEALGYQVLLEEHGLTQEEISKRVGKSRPVIANALRLLRLPDSVLQKVRQGAISAGHARALLSLEETQKILPMAEEICKKGLSVREVERLCRSLNQEKQQPPSPPIQQEKPPTYLKEMELALYQALARKVRIRPQGTGGVLELDFHSEEDLRQLAELLTGETLT